MSRLLYRLSYATKFEMQRHSTNRARACQVHAALLCAPPYTRL